MPRTARSEARGAVYHVIARGIERRTIFFDDSDREYFLDRIGRLLVETETTIYSFALIPNHFHLLLLRREAPLSTFMQRLLTAYAVYFNKRHRRSGHLFQNRYKADICLDDVYFRELVRYINLNPARAGLVGSLPGLASYRYCSHGYILGKQRAAWFEPEAVLNFFQKEAGPAQVAYANFVDAGYSGSEAEREVFPPALIADGVGAAMTHRRKKANAIHESDLPAMMAEICKNFAITPEELLGASRVRRVSQARAALACMLSERGLSKSDIARQLGVSLTAVLKMINKYGNDVRKV